MAEDKQPRGLSAAQASRSVKSRRPASDKPAPTRYTLRKNGEPVLQDALYRDVRAFLPKTPEHLLVKRLATGERDVDRLTRKPDTRQQIKQRLTPGRIDAAHRARSAIKKSK